MKAKLLIIFFFFMIKCPSQEVAMQKLPVRGICIRLPQLKNSTKFTQFIENELTRRGINTLILRVDYNYQYKSHPELSYKNAWPADSIKKIVSLCRKSKITLVPLFDFFGHQSWQNMEYNLLKYYPQFDETPEIKMPEKFIWPNPDSLACKSYCPLHPDLHKVIFDLIDELCNICESKNFHAGMDEVLFIGSPNCPRCSGKNKAQLFADEVNLIQNHLAKKKRRLWIWGDRLIDGRSTGIGMWEASLNYTFPAINLINKKVLICDWHYNKPEKTPQYFAQHGFDVISCFWYNETNAKKQIQDLFSFKKVAPNIEKPHYKGFLQTIWSDGDSFLENFYTQKGSENDEHNLEIKCFKKFFSKLKR